MKNWYIVQSHSSFENKVASLIKEEADKAKISEKFEEIVVPTHDVTEVKRGKRIQRKKKYFPGYVLIKSEMDNNIYHMIKNMPEQKDSEFTWNDYKDRVNNELADVLGNFVNRVVVLSKKYYKGSIPKAPSTSDLTDVDQQLVEVLQNAPPKIADLIQRHRYREAQLAAMNVARAGNKYLTEEEPWKLFKTEPARVETIMHLACQVVANLGILLEPFLPRTAGKLADAMQLDKRIWSEASASLVSEGTIVGDLPILFTKVDDDFVASQMERLGNNTNPNVMPQKDATTFDNFTQMDLRVAEVVDCIPVKKADKLLQLTVDTGLDTRTVVSGIAEHFTPEDVIGRKVVLLANLEPRKIRGVESQGMVLMASTADGGLRFITPEEGVGPGDVIS